MHIGNSLHFLIIGHAYKVPLLCSLDSTVCLHADIVTHMLMHTPEHNAMAYTTIYGIA